MPTVLVVDDERTQLILLKRLLARAGYEVQTAEGAEEALQIVQTQPVSVVVTDIRMPGMSGRELLERLRELDPKLPVIIMTAYPQLRDAVELVAHGGAFYYIEKPIEDIRVLTQEIERALEGRENGRGTSSPTSEEAGSGEFRPFPGIVGSSPPMRRLIREMRKLLPILGGPATVLITGESGTGKELVAKALHEHGPRREGPFIAVHCAAIPHELMEAELFGAEKGAYTGATHSRPGYFEEAEGGTIFLDEIAEVPPTTQVKLLRVLSSRE
ncbi:MAG: hypothetical protein KatS3mg115_1917 [Candidatus Poribacteria bacterium]|nr:MAG: hypothetical protein KatS3mg115_1917 [Candidatus Poribacteria bacterium]